MDISSEETQRKIDIIKNQLDNDQLDNDQIKEYYKNDEIVIIRDDVDIPDNDIFKEIKKKYLNNIGKIVDTMLHDDLIRIHIPKKKYDLYWNYKDCVPIKLLDKIPDSDNEELLESINNKPFRKIAFIVENDKESETIQKKLFDNGYIWNGSEQIIKIHHFDIYPVILFAYIDKMVITMMELHTINGYYLGKLEKLKNGTYKDTYPILFDISMLSKYTNLIKYKRDTPSYEPKRIERTLESKNSINEAEEICIKIDNKDDLHKFEKLIISHKIGFEISDELTQSEIDDISTDSPIWMFIMLDDYYITHLTTRKWLENDNELGNIYSYMCDGVWDKILNINTDLYLIQKILKDQKITLILPTYEPKRIERTLESRNSFNEAKEICIEFDDKKQFKIFDELTKKHTDYNFEEIANQYAKSHVDILSKNNPIRIFIRLDDFETLHMIEKPDLSDDVFDGVWDKVLNIDVDTQIIIDTLRNKKVTIAPNYRPRKIERTLESNNSIKEAKEICIMFDSKKQFEKFENLINKNDIKYNIANNIINSYTNDVSKDNPIWIFIELKNYETLHMLRKDWEWEGIKPNKLSSLSLFNGVWDRILNIDNDAHIIVNTLKNRKITNIPTYKPRKITRTLEMNNLKKYDDFILESVNDGDLVLILSQRLRELLKQINHPISKKLLDTDLDEDKEYNVTLVDMSTDDDKVTVVSSNKITELLSDHIKGFNSDTFSYFVTDSNSGYIWNKFRNIIKIGKLVKKLFPDEFDDNGNPGEDVESFVNEYKTIFNEESKINLFDVVKGKDIIYWYKLDNYGENSYGSILGNSCMAEGCDDFINFYAINSKKVSMLILYDDDDKEAIAGRALLWNIDEIDGVQEKRIFMDRVYTIHEYQVDYFIKYAKEHDYLYKEDQTFEQQRIIDPIILKETSDNMDYNGDYMNLTVYDINMYRYFPYLDTLKYLNVDKKTLSNDDFDNPDGSLLYLINTDGAPTNGIYSKKYNRWIDEDDKNFVKCNLMTSDLNSSEKYRRIEDSVYLSYYNEYIPKDRYENNVVQVGFGGDVEILKNDAVFLDYYGEWASKNAISSLKYSKYSKIYLINDDAIFSKKLDSYLIEDESIKVYTDVTKTDFDYLPDNSDELKNLSYSIKGDYILKK